MPNIKGEYIVPVYTWSDDQTAIDKGYAELIRCKECKHILISAQLEHRGGDVTNYYMCDYWHRATDEDGYCHRAERKEDDA